MFTAMLPRLNAIGFNAQGKSLSFWLVGFARGKPDSARSLTNTFNRLRQYRHDGRVSGTCTNEWIGERAGLALRVAVKTRWSRADENEKRRAEA
jgi:hypothetical protein